MSEPTQRAPTAVSVTVRCSLGSRSRPPDGAAQTHVETVLGQPLGQPLAPLDDGHRGVQRQVQVEVVELERPPGPPRAWPRPSR